MKQFKDFGIKARVKSFVGEKIKIQNILDKPIIIHAYKIARSKFEKLGKEDCLHVQIEFSGEKRVFFCGSLTLIDILKQVPEESFPFEATLTKKDERLIFI